MTLETDALIERRRLKRRLGLWRGVGVLALLGLALVALAADRVFARESSLTGSIGVLFQSAEFSKLLEKAGITPLSVTSGPYKDEPSPFRPLTESGRRVLQEMVNESHRWFVGLVADRRKMPTERVAKIADGRIYSGRAAVDLGLVDALGGEREAREWLAQTHGISADLPVQDLPTQ